MNTLWEKYKFHIIVTVIVIAIILTIYFYGKSQGKAKVQGPQVNYPKGGKDIPAGWDPEVLAKKLYSVMKGLFTTARPKEEAWGELSALPTDEMVIAVYNTFNQLYFSKGDGTLTDWIRDESYYDPFFSVKDEVLKRLERLRLK